MFVVGIDGCRAGWVSFHVEIATRVATVDLVNLVELLRDQPNGLLALAIDIPIGLLEVPRPCDLAARKLLGQPRGSSVFPPPCRAALAATTYADACRINSLHTGRKISRQAFGIVPKIREVDEAMTPFAQDWAFEVHPEMCFWALNESRPMLKGKKSASGKAQRLSLLRTVFPEMDIHIKSRRPGIEADDVIDAAAAAWTALRHSEGRARQVCPPEVDARQISATIWY